MITNASTPSKIATTVADTLLAAFAGQTVSHHEVCAEIESQYVMARKRCTFGSYVQIIPAMERAGMFSYYTGPGYTGDLLYTFPVRAI